MIHGQAFYLVIWQPPPPPFSTMFTVISWMSVEVPLTKQGTAKQETDKLLLSNTHFIKQGTAKQVTDKLLLSNTHFITQNYIKYNSPSVT